MGADMMMNCMDSGTGSWIVGGIRLADWATGLTDLLLALLVVITIVAARRIVIAILRPSSRAVDLRARP